jgi:hypothetical protein
MTTKRSWSVRISVVLALCVILSLVSSGLAAAAPGRTTTTTYIISLDKDYSRKFDEQSTFKLINQLLDMGAPVKWALKDFRAGNERYPAGTFFLQTPFQTTSGFSSDLIVSWMESQGKQTGVWPIKHTTAAVQVESKALVPPRIALFYDQTTYENCLKHYELLTGMGFKVTLATANDLLVSPSDPTSALAHSNVFIMPGGALHLYSFSDPATGIANIQNFVNAGGGYIGVCAGSSESLKQTPYTNLGLVDANYHSEWFQNADPAAGDWEWRQLIGPIHLEITAPQNPVMFGYGASAVRPGYGPMPTMYYWGGPAMFNLGSGATALARYANPTNQTVPDKVKNIWGEAAVVAADYGQGKAVVFGPHPEWPDAGPCGRMYAQALYYVAKQAPIASSPAPAAGNLPALISASRVQAITGTVNSARPVLNESIQMAKTLNNLKLGEFYHPLGLWYEEPVLVYTQALKGQMDELSRDAALFALEYARLSALKPRVAGNPQALAWIKTTQAYIEQFFQYAENLPAESHVIETTPGWGVAGPFVPYTDETKKFPDLLYSFSYVKQEIKDFDLPVAQAYEPLLAQYDALRAAYLADPTDANKQAMDAEYLALSAWPGPMYAGMYTLQHALDIMQYKVDTHLLNLLSRADQAKAVLSVSEQGLSGLVRNWKPVCF